MKTGVPLMPSKTPVRSSGPPLKRARTALVPGPTPRMSPSISTWNSSGVVPGTPSCLCLHAWFQVIQAKELRACPSSPLSDSRATATTASTLRRIIPKAFLVSWSICAEPGLPALRRSVNRGFSRVDPYS